MTSSSTAPRACLAVALTVVCAGLTGSTRPAAQHVGTGAHLESGKALYLK
jgi:hypothetical protein